MLTLSVASSGGTQVFIRQTMISANIRLFKLIHTHTHAHTFKKDANMIQIHDASLIANEYIELHDLYDKIIFQREYVSTTI